MSKPNIIEVGNFDELVNVLQDMGILKRNPQPQPNVNTQSTPKDTKPAQTDIKSAPSDAVGSVFSVESLEAAIKQQESEMADATAAFQTEIAKKKKTIDALRTRLNEEKEKTVMTRQGSNVALTMTRANAETLLQSLTQLLNGDTEKQQITVNVDNVR